MPTRHSSGTAAPAAPSGAGARVTTRTAYPPPSAEEKEIWAQIADELDKYLAGDGSVQMALLEEEDVST